MNKTFFSLIAFLFLIAFTSCEKETITQNLETATDVSVTDKTGDLGLKNDEPPFLVVQHLIDVGNPSPYNTGNGNSGRLTVVPNSLYGGPCTGTPNVTWTVEYDGLTPQTDYSTFTPHDPLEFPSAFSGDDFEAGVNYTITVYVNYGFDSDCQFSGTFCYQIEDLNEVRTYDPNAKMAPLEFIDPTCGGGNLRIYTGPGGEMVACAWGP